MLDHPSKVAFRLSEPGIILNSKFLIMLIKKEKKSNKFLFLKQYANALLNIISMKGTLKYK